MQKFHAAFITCIIALTALACILWIFLQIRQNADPENTFVFADIYQDGTLIQSIPLDPSKEPYSFTVTGENDCCNEITVKGGSIGITSADCPDKLCVKQGFISTSLLPITCLPNRVVIQIRMKDHDTGTENGSSAVDVISY